MKLELKHLSPYLAHKLKVRNKNIDFTVWQVDFTEDLIYGQSHLDIDDGYYPYTISSIKPFLVPISELKKYENFNIDKQNSLGFINLRNEILSFFDNDVETFDWFITMLITNEPVNEDWTLDKITEINEILAKYKIDIFNLIPNKLAIPICL